LAFDVHVDRGVELKTSTIVIGRSSSTVNGSPLPSLLTPTIALSLSVNPFSCVEKEFTVLVLILSSQVVDLLLIKTAVSSCRWCDLYGRWPSLRLTFFN